MFFAYALYPSRDKFREGRSETNYQRLRFLWRHWHQGHSVGFIWRRML